METIKGKRILFDIGHPAQVHQFRHLYAILEKKGWKCLFVAKDKEMAKFLLEYYKLEFVLLSKNKKGLLLKIMGLLKDYVKFYRIIKQFRPSFVLHRFSLHASHISKLTRVTSIGFSDTEHANILHKITAPFVDLKITGSSYMLSLGRNQIFFDGNIELFYLHKNHFQPSCNPFDALKISNNQPFCIVRFVSWDAHHDIGVQKLSSAEKLELIKLLEIKYKVFISSEKPLPNQFRKYEINISPHHIHTLLMYAELYLGEGGTMASEAAVLNTPAIYINHLPLMGYLEEEESFNLLYYKHSYEEIKRIIEDLPQTKYNEFMKNKIDVTAFMAWFINDYPESLKTIKEDPDYQYNFK